MHSIPLTDSPHHLERPEWPSKGATPPSGQTVVTAGSPSHSRPLSLTQPSLVSLSLSNSYESCLLISYSPSRPFDQNDGKVTTLVLIETQPGTERERERKRGREREGERASRGISGKEGVGERRRWGRRVGVCVRGSWRDVEGEREGGGVGERGVSEQGGALVWAHWSKRGREREREGVVGERVGDGVGATVGDTVGSRVGEKVGEGDG